MGTFKVLIIDPKKEPYFRDVDLTSLGIEAMIGEDGLEHYSSYEVAKVLLDEFSSETWVQKVHDAGTPHLGIFIDEEGRLKRLEANRLYITASGWYHKIAGRMVIFPDIQSDELGDSVCNQNEGYAEVIEKEFNTVLSHNNDDGQGPITALSQEESDDLSHAHQVYSLSDLLDFFGLMGHNVMDEDDDDGGDGTED